VKLDRYRGFASPEKAGVGKVGICTRAFLRVSIESSAGLFSQRPVREDAYGRCPVGFVMILSVATGT